MSQAENTGATWPKRSTNAVCVTLPSLADWIPAREIESREQLNARSAQQGLVNGESGLNLSKLAREQKKSNYNRVSTVRI